MARLSIEYRFWNKVQKTSDCWLWLGCINSSGYGQFKFQGRVVGAHRVAWTLTYGKQPALSICHKCDTPKCVRPDHLFEGTHLDNVHDAMEKGRFPYRGCANAISRFTPVEVGQIRYLHSKGFSGRDLGYLYKASSVTINAICSRRSYK